MKLLFDESLSPKLAVLLADLFPASESALRNGLARAGDQAILRYAIKHEFVLVTTDRDFHLLCARPEFRGAVVVILAACNYPTEAASELVRRNAIRISEAAKTDGRVIVLDRW